MEVDDEATQDEIINIVDPDDTDDEDVKPVLPSSVKQEEEERIGPEGLKKPKVCSWRGGKQVGREGKLES